MSKTICALRAVDWGITSEQMPSTYEFEIVEGMVVGWLIRETEDIIVITQQFFRDNGVRLTLAIPKCTVKWRKDFEVEEQI